MIGLSNHCNERADVVHLQNHVGTWESSLRKWGASLGFVVLKSGSCPRGRRPCRARTSSGPVELAAVLVRYSFRLLANESYRLAPASIPAFAALASTDCLKAPSS